MNKGFINGSKSMTCGGALQRKKLRIGKDNFAPFLLLAPPLSPTRPLRQQPESVTAKRAMAIRCPQ